MHVLMSEPHQKTQHHADAQECHGFPLRKPLFFPFIAPLPACSGVEKNVAAASYVAKSSSSQKLRSARPEWTVPA